MLLLIFQINSMLQSIATLGKSELCSQVMMFPVFTHQSRDVAARNFLVSSVDKSSALQVRLSDFGMARQILTEQHYTMRGGAVPVRWYDYLMKLKS